MTAPRSRSAQLFGLWPAGVAVLSLAPFLGKPFNMDDTLFLYGARHILLHPLDFYGFSINWYGHVMPMAAVMKNPPLACYYYALVGFLFGFGERAIHLAGLAPAAAAMIGVYRVAGRFTKHAVFAALVCLATPVFLVSGATAMCDMLLLAFWCWAIDCWLRGRETKSLGWFFLAGALAGLAVLTKFFGVALLPLLLLFWLLDGRRPKLGALALLLPLVVLAGYELYTSRLYGVAFAADVAGYSLGHVGSGYAAGGWFTRALIGLEFMGGVLLTALLLATAIRRRTTDLWPLAVCVLLACLALLIVPPRQFFPQMVPLSAAHVAHLLIFLISGLWILAVVVADLAGRRDREAVFLACWLIGTLVFTTFVNWTISGRNLLPAAPVLGILLARRLEERAKIDARAMRRPALVLLLLLAYFLSLGVTAGDYQWAKTIKENAGVIHQKYAPLAGAIWFQGHWGFQYYLEALGHSPLNFDGSRILPRDLLVVPLNNTNLEKVDRDHFTLVDRATAVVPSLFAVLSVREGVGFYSTVFGPLPFALGLPTIESYEVWRLSQP